MSLRYPLIEARLQRTVWAATPDLAYAMVKALRNPGAGPIQFGAEGRRPQVEAALQRFALAPEGGRMVRAEQSGEQSTVAVIQVFGVTGKYLSGMDAECGDGFDLRGLERSLREIEADPSVKAGVIHFHSPGGSVTGIPEAAQLLNQVSMTKPIYAYTDSEMCSAAQWLGAASTAVFASPMARVASIGVFLAWIDDSVAMEAGGYKLILIKDGEFKASTLPGQLTEDAAALLLAEVKAYGSAFRSDVVRWRKAACGIEVPQSAMEGQVILARDALEVGLVDGLYRSLDDLLLDITTTQKDTNP